eukprot:1096899-Heterocapsa_arctica.AAC.1
MLPFALVEVNRDPALVGQRLLAAQGDLDQERVDDDGHVGRGRLHEVVEDAVDACSLAALGLGEGQLEGRQ